MIIRPLTSPDKEKILALLSQRGTFNQDEIRVAIELLEEKLGHPQREDYEIFCALDGTDDLVGYICFGPIPMTEGCYDLYWIVVDERRSREGIGQKLLTFMEGFVVGKRARRVYLDTSSTPPYEPARSFYVKHGYGLVSVLEDFYRPGDDKMIYMKEVGNGAL